MSPEEREWYLEEFKALRREIDQRIGESGRIRTTSVIWVAVIYAWLSNKDGVTWLTPIGLTPSLWPLIAVIGAFLISALSAAWIFENEHKIRMIGDYIRELEKRLNITGWEHRSTDRKLWQSIIVYGLLPLMTGLMTVVAIIATLRG